MHINPFLLLLIAGNLFQTGRLFQAVIDDDDFEDTDKGQLVKGFLILMTVGLPWGICSVLINKLPVFIKSWSTKLQLKFFTLFLFTQRFDNLSKKTIADYNWIAETHFNTNSFEHRVYRFGVRCINRRNSYGQRNS